MNIDTLTSEQLKARSASLIQKSNALYAEARDLSIKTDTEYDSGIIDTKRMTMLRAKVNALHARGYALAAQAYLCDMMIEK